MKTALLTGMFMFQSLSVALIPGGALDAYKTHNSTSTSGNTSLINDKPGSQTQNCNNVNWVSWNSFKGRSAEGSVKSKGGKIKVTMNSSFSFSSSPRIFELKSHFITYPRAIPDVTVPSMSWSKGPGTTKVCFSQTVKDPVLLLASLGNRGVRATLRFSEPYTIDFKGSGMQFDNNRSITGVEGYAVIKFKGDLNCVTIYSSVYEYFSNITFGISACTDIVKPVVAVPPPPRTKPVIPPKPVVSKVKPTRAPKVPATQIKPVPRKEILKAIKIPAVPPPRKITRLKIQIWDTDCMDFDSISLKFNGKRIGPVAIPIQLYKREAPEFTYTLDLQERANILEVHAISEGVKPLVSIGLLIMYSDEPKKVYYTLKAKETKVIEL